MKEGLEAEIVETEAYLGEEDPASHASSGKTERNTPMYEEVGKAYVYVSYGVHDMFNVVAHPEEGTGAVLIRAARPVKGIEEMKENRGGQDEEGLCDGPGKLCEALDIDKSDNKADLTGGDFRVEKGRKIENIGESSRIGISEGLEFEYRYFVEGSEYVSR